MECAVSGQATRLAVISALDFERASLTAADARPRPSLSAYQCGIGSQRAYDVARSACASGADLSLRQILALVAAETGRPEPRIRLPHWFVRPVAEISELWARVVGGEPRVSVDGVRMAAKHMYFSSARARTELGYRSRAPEAAVAAAVDWFRRHDYL